MKTNSQIAKILSDLPQFGIRYLEYACRENFYFFVETFWHTIIKEKPVYNWHIKYLCDELQKLSVSIVNRQPKPYDLIINIPPGTTKSTITTIMFPVWLWTQDPSLRIITNSYSMDLSIEHATKSRDIITSDNFRKLFPEIVLRNDKSAKTSYENKSTGARYATSTGGTITGKHAHIIINDDPVNPQQAMSDVKRKEANEHTKTLASRKVDKINTPTCTIMQRLHEQDVTGYLLDKKADRIRHICLPAEISNKVSPVELKGNYINGLLDPIRLSKEVLAEQKIDLGTRGYEGQFGQNPLANRGYIIKKDWFPFVTEQKFSQLHANEPIVFFGDTAYTDKDEDNDPSGFIATCRIGNDMYITSAKKVYMEFPELLAFLPPYLKSNGYTSASTVRIEPKANGKSVVQTLKRATNLNILETPTPTDDKKTRLTAISPKVESGRVILIHGAWNDEFIDEITGFPAKVHDEYVDLISYAVDFHLGKEKKVKADVSELLNNLF